MKNRRSGWRYSNDERRDSGREWRVRASHREEPSVQPQHNSLRETEKKCDGGWGATPVDDNVPADLTSAWEALATTNLSDWSKPPQIDSVEQWDDTGAKETWDFVNISRLPVNNPDLYLETNIDWNSKIPPDLLAFVDDRGRHRKASPPRSGSPVLLGLETLVPSWGTNAPQGNGNVEKAKEKLELGGGSGSWGDSKPGQRRAKQQINERVSGEKQSTLMRDDYRDRGRKRRGDKDEYHRKPRFRTTHRISWSVSGRMALQRGQEGGSLRPHMDGQPHESSAWTQLKEHYAACALNRASATSMSSADLRCRILAPLTLETVKSLLAHIESRLTRLSVHDQYSSINTACIGPLLRRISSPPAGEADAPTGGVEVRAHHCGNVAPTPHTDHPRGGGGLATIKVGRYSERVFLIAYMILGHPEAVFSGQGEQEMALAGAAGKLVPAFESLTGMILDGASPTSGLPSLRPSAAAAVLAAFDEAWCDYLFALAAWRVKDVRVIEEDLTRMACQLEVPMLQECEVPGGGGESALSHAVKAIDTRVLEDQKLLGDKIFRLTGSAGVTRMRNALEDARTKYANNLANEQCPPGSRAGCTACHLNTYFPDELAVNEMFHVPMWYLQETDKLRSTLKLSSAVDSKKMRALHSQVRSTMETASSDEVASRLVQEPTNYEHVLVLLGDIRKGLKAIVPKHRKRELCESMDLELIAQILNSGSNDVEYFHQLLNYASGLILELGAPARDIAAKAAYESLIKEVSTTGSSSSKDCAFLTTLVKGLGFVFEQLQVLKQDMCISRIRELAPEIGGTLGVDYLRGAFSTRYQVTTASSIEELTQKLPKTVAWVTEAISGLERERMELQASLVPVQESLQSASLASVSVMRSGFEPRRGIPTTAMPTAVPSAGLGKKFCEVQWDSSRTLVHLGLLQILRSNEGADVESIAETLALNSSRLLGYQNASGQIIVMATGLLIVRQELVAQGTAGLQLEGLVEAGAQKLETLLDDPLASLLQVGTVLADVANKTDEAEPSDSKCGPVARVTAELMTGVLTTSLSHYSPVYAGVSSAVGAALRALLLLGKGPEGMAAARAALKKIGGLCVMDKVVAISDSLGVVAEATCKVHEPWYSCILEGVQSQVQDESF